MIFRSPTRTTAELIHRFARNKGTTVQELQGPNRKRPVVHWRQECMAMLKEETDLTLPQIGRIFNRDHTTVIHSLAAVKKRAEHATQ